MCLAGMRLDPTLLHLQQPNQITYGNASSVLPLNQSIMILHEGGHSTSPELLEQSPKPQTNQLALDGIGGW